MSLHIGPLIIV